MRNNLRGFQEAQAITLKDLNEFQLTIYIFLISNNYLPEDIIQIMLGSDNSQINKQGI